MRGLRTARGGRRSPPAIRRVAALHALCAAWSGRRHTTAARACHAMRSTTHSTQRNGRGATAPEREQRQQHQRRQQPIAFVLPGTTRAPLPSASASRRIEHAPSARRSARPGQAPTHRPPPLRARAATLHRAARVPIRRHARYAAPARCRARARTRGNRRCAASAGGRSRAASSAWSVSSTMSPRSRPPAATTAPTTRWRDRHAGRPPASCRAASASRNKATFAASSVSGATVYASSAKTTSPTWPPSRSRSNVAILARACASRDGGRSAASAALDRSSAITSGVRLCHSGCSDLPPARPGEREHRQRVGQHAPNQ